MTIAKISFSILFVKQDDSWSTSPLVCHGGVYQSNFYWKNHQKEDQELKLKRDYFALLNIRLGLLPMTVSKSYLICLGDLCKSINLENF